MDRIELLLSFHSLEDILDMNDIEEIFVLRWLVEEGLVDLDEYFEGVEERED